MRTAWVANAAGRWALCAMVALVTLFVSPAAHASCAPIGPLEDEIADAEYAFIGTVVEVTNGGTWATVDVSEVWQGNVGDRVEVRGGPKDPPGKMAVATSVDRGYADGRTYLFVPHARRDDAYLDNICTATTPFNEGLRRFEPEAPTDPNHPHVPGDRSDSSWRLVAAAAAIVAGAAISFGARFRRRRSGTLAPR